MHFSMRSDNLDPPGMTNSHLQAYYKIHQIRSVRESGKARRVQLAGAALPVLHDKLHALPAGLAGIRSRKSGAWKEQEVKGAKEGFASSQGWINSALLSARHRSSGDSQS